MKEYKGCFISQVPINVYVRAKNKKEAEKKLRASALGCWRNGDSFLHCSCGEKSKPKLVPDSIKEVK